MFLAAKYEGATHLTTLGMLGKFNGHSTLAPINTSMYISFVRFIEFYKIFSQIGFVFTIVVPVAENGSLFTHDLGHRYSVITDNKYTHTRNYHLEYENRTLNEPSNAFSCEGQ